MKTISTAIILLICVTSKAQEYKWDVGVKYERDNNSWLQLEGRYHLNERFALIGQVSGSQYNSSHFGYSGFSETDSIYYYSNSQRYGSLAKLSLGAQYTFPFKKKFLYTGFTIGVGYSETTNAYSYYTGPHPHETFSGYEMDPNTSAGYSYYNYFYFTVPPQNGVYTYRNAFITTDILVGTDLRIHKRLFFTASLKGGVRVQQDYVQFNFSLAAGLRYQLGKNAEKSS